MLSPPLLLPEYMVLKTLSRFVRFLSPLVKCVDVDIDLFKKFRATCDPYHDVVCVDRRRINAIVECFNLLIY
jgi:hypothetical protein